jgi:Zn-dependent oligopeptidases
MVLVFPPTSRRTEKINEQLSTLSLQFGNNLLKENAGFKLVIDNEADLAGLPQTSIDAAVEQAKSEGLEGKWVFTLSKPSLIPFLQFADNRALREQMYKAYYNRGDNNNEFDNKNLINEMCKLRVQKAKLFGYDNYADYVLAVNMAQDSKTVDKFLIDIFNPAQQLAKKELTEMQAIADRKALASNSKVGTGGTMLKNSARPSMTSTRTTSSLTSPSTMSATACSWLPTS